MFKKKKNMLSEEEQRAGAIKRQKIIKDAEAMNRLSKNPDYLRFCEMLEEDISGLNATLLRSTAFGVDANEQRIRLIARINQIDRVLKKPNNLIWQSKNLTEVRDAIKEQTNVRQTDGNKTGG